MQADGAQANVITYVATLSASSKSWQWQPATGARGDVQSNRLRTSVIPHNVAFSACSKDSPKQRALSSFAEICLRLRPTGHCQGKRLLGSVVAFEGP